MRSRVQHAAVQHPDIKAYCRKPAACDAIEPVGQNTIMQYVDNVAVAVRAFALLVAVHCPPYAKLIPVGELGVFNVQQGRD
ncbi:MAG TPA: hypothetical protein VFV38_28280 [Ktedonobacteraceae bacterium]|nr:hypothetical protein [Ktedonobacteraceae bacterium]